MEVIKEEIKQRYDQETGLPLFQPNLKVQKEKREDKLRLQEENRQKIAISAHLFIQAFADQKVILSNFKLLESSERYKKKIQDLVNYALATP